MSTVAPVAALHTRSCMYDLVDEADFVGLCLGISHVHVLVMIHLWEGSIGS